MKTFLKIAIGLILLVAILAAAGYAWASSATAQAFEQTVEVHDVDFPVPYPEAAPEAGACLLYTSDAADESSSV